MKLFNELKLELIGLGDFLIRNITWVLLILVGLYFLEPTTELLNKLTLLVVLEGLALGLSGVASYVYTKVKFTKVLIYGEDFKLNSVERHSLIDLLGKVFIGVHILVGVGFFILQLAEL